MPGDLNEQDELAMVLDEAADALSSWVIPIYQTVRDRPSAFGSGFFVTTGEDCFLVSAGHVLRSLETTRLFYFIEPRLERAITGTVRLARDDAIDVGVVKLTREALPPYPLVDKVAMPLANLTPNRVPRAGRHYLVLGFPASRNASNPVARETPARAYAYRASSSSDDTYGSLGLDPATHIAIPLDLKRGRDAKGAHRNFPRPQGMSGSPVWEMFDDDGEGEHGGFPIVGVAIEYWNTRKVMVATDIRFVLDLIVTAE